MSDQISAVLGALQYLAGTVQWYKQNYTTKRVLEQLHDVSWNLDRIAGYFAEYDDPSIGEPFSTVIIKCMDAFLQLCTIYEKVRTGSTSASGKLNGFLKSVVRLDDGIEACIKMIKESTERELNLNVAAIRKSDLANNERRFQTEDAKMLRRVLGVDETSEHWQETQRQLQQKNVTGVGDWLFDESSKFMLWANTQSDSNPAMLLLTGESGIGKTHICSRAIQYLGGIIKSSQTSVAWFYARKTDYAAPSKKDGKKTETPAKPGNNPGKKKSADTEQPEDAAIHAMLLALVWQLAESNRNFQKFVAKQLQNTSPAFWSSSQLWSDLINKFCTSHNNDSHRRTVLFLVIDGDSEFTDAGSKKLLTDIRRDMKNMQKRSYRFQIRMLISIRKNIFGKESQPEKLMSEIELPKSNRDFDVKLFVDHGLGQLLEPESRATDRYKTLYSLKKKLISMFGDSNKGDLNYYNLSDLIEEIRHIDASERSIYELRRLEEHLEKDKNSNKVIVPNQLNRLNRYLTAEERLVFNDILSCMICFCDCWPSLEQINAFVALRRKTFVRINLERMIREKFNNILNLQPEGNTSLIVAQNVGDFFDDEDMRLWIAQEYEDLTQTFEQRSELQHAKDAFPLTPESAAHQALIASFLSSTQGKPKPHSKVEFSRQRSHSGIVTFLLRAVCSEDHKDRAEMKSLQSYAGLRLGFHMWKLNPQKFESSKNGSDKKSDKKEIGKNIYKFFMKRESVKTWLLQSDPRSLREAWWCIYLVDFQTWLKDESVLHGFQEAESSGHSNTKNTTHDGSEASTKGKIKNKGITQLGLLSTQETPKESSESSESVSEPQGIDQSRKTDVVDTFPNIDGVSSITSPLPEFAGRNVDSKRKNPLLLLSIIEVSASQWLRSFDWNASEALRWLVIVLSEVSLQMRTN